MTDPRSFGAWLRRERERRTITLRAISDRTKIGVGLLESLERGDVSRWPGGIYRRSFVRGYAEAVGLDAELVLANFERLFPAAGGDSKPDRMELAAAPQPQDAELRLQLAEPATVLDVPALQIAGRDVLITLAFGASGWLAAGAVGFWCALAVSALVLHLTTIIGGRVTAPDRSRQPLPLKVDRPLAQVVSFSQEQGRAASRRSRARQVMATLSAAASHTRWRAARS
jgi:transcriptional regulator with XRE-family HTH domain